MITQTEKQRLKEQVQDLFNEAQKDYKVFDCDSMIDSNLSYGENYEIIIQEVKKLIGIPLYTKKEFTEMQERYTFMEQSQEKEDILNYNNLNQVRTIAVYGDCGSGKTALSFKILECFAGKKDIYLFKYPKKELLRGKGFKFINSLHDLEHLNNCVLYIDEPQIHLNLYDKKSNDIIARLCSLARQRSIILILSTSDTRVLTKHNEAYIDLWLIKDTDAEMVKNGSKIKQIIKENCYIDYKCFRLNKNEFLSYSRTLRDYNGRHLFGLPNNWNDDLSHAYS